MTDSASPKTSLARIAALAESPSVRQAREILNDPLFRPNKQFEEALRVTRLFEEQRPEALKFLEIAKGVQEN